MYKNRERKVHSKVQYSRIKGRKQEDKRVVKEVIRSEHTYKVCGDAS